LVRPAIQSVIDKESQMPRQNRFSFIALLLAVFFFTFTGFGPHFSALAQTGKMPQTITFPYVAQISYQYAATSPILTATASSGLPVTYISQTPTVCTVSESSTSVWTISLLISGSCSLVAYQGGNSVYSEAPSIGQTFWVYHASQTITFPYVALTSYQYAATAPILTATASSGLPVTYISQTPTVCTVSESGTGVWSVSLLISGSCSLGAEQAGNATYAAAPFSGQTFWVYHAAQMITFPYVALTSYQYAATAPILTATASSGLPVTYISQTPTVCTVSESGTGVWTVSLLISGSCSLEAEQAGNSTYAAAWAGQTFWVYHAAQTITFPAIAPQTAGTTVTLGATASSSLAVSYASTTTAVCTVSGATASLLTAGTCTIQAAQSGNATYSAAATVKQSFKVTAAATKSAKRGVA
jgi:hypothetical protein